MLTISRPFTGRTNVNVLRSNKSCLPKRPSDFALAYHYMNEENGLVLRRYWTNACQSCAIKHSCITGKQRRITRWEHKHVLEAVQQRLDENPQAMRQRRETAGHPFATLKMRMGATHCLMKRLPKVATEMALHMLAYNLTRVRFGVARQMISNHQRPRTPVNEGRESPSLSRFAARSEDDAS
jgi:hypothetical protein